SGAATAFNEDTNNRQLHPVEMSFLAAEAAKYAEYAKISEKEAMQLLIAASLDQLDSTAQEKTTGQDAAKYQAAANWLASEAADAHLGFVNEKGELQQAFTATKSQFYDPTLYDQPYRGNLLTKITDKVFDTHLTAGHSITMDDYLSVASDLKLEGQYQLWRATRPADMSKWSADDLQTMSGFVQKNDLRLMAKLGIFGPIGANWVSLSDGDYKGVVDNAAINFAGGVVPVGSAGRSLEHAAETASEVSGEVRGINGAAKAGADGEANVQVVDGTIYKKIDVSSGQKGGWNKDLNTPEPNAIYNVDGNKVYRTNSNGDVEYLEANLSLNTKDRNGYQQCKVGKCGDVDDEGGHLVASIFDGPGEKLNLVPMNSNLNKGAWKTMENTWASALKEGKSVNVKIEPIYSGNSSRADRFLVRYSIDGARPVYVDFKNSPGGI
ncbi:DNA/RNA non-specific endonuclease, partial [Xanthomonas oryzae]